MAKNLVMTRRPAPFPQPLVRRVFSVSEAEAAGISRGTLAHGRFARPFHGVRYLAEPKDEPEPHTYLAQRIAQRAQEYRPRLRSGEAFSHTTALLLLGVPILCPADLHTMIPIPGGQARGRGVIGHRSRAPFVTVAGVHGLPCVSLVTALMQAAPLLEPRERVVAIDHLLCPRFQRHRVFPTSPEICGVRSPGVPLFEPEHLAQELSKNKRLGAAPLQAAMRLARPGAESRMETFARLELAGLGVSSFEPQVDIVDADGTWIGRFDLVDRVAKRIIEYDGEQHRTDRAQYRHDRLRLDRVWGAGYRVLRLSADDLRPGAQAELRRTLRTFLGISARPVPAALRPFLP